MKQKIQNMRKDNRWNAKPAKPTQLVQFSKDVILFTVNNLPLKLFLDQIVDPCIVKHIC